MRPTLHHNARRARRMSAGVTLVELLVAVLLGTVMVIAITTIVMRSEAGRRSLTTTNDSSQNAAYVALTLDRSLRSAGSGFSQAWRQAFGCRVLAARSGTQVLPRSTDFPAPFASVPRTLRLAPLVVYAGAGANGSDVLAVASGASGLGETPVHVVAGSASSSQLGISATVGMRAKDLVLVLQDTNNCMVQQVAEGFTGGATQTLSFGGTYAKDTIDSVDLASMGVNTPALLAPLGNISGNQPAIQLLGISSNATLVSYDALRIDGSDSVTPIADSVVDLRARYGIDSDGDGTIDAWVSPASSPYTAASLMAGSDAGQRNLAGIKAVRVGVILRGAVPEREAVSAATLTLFGDLEEALRHSLTLSSSEQLLRHRIVEFTVPLRNVMLMPRI